MKLGGVAVGEQSVAPSMCADSLTGLVGVRAARSSLHVAGLLARSSLR